MEYAVKHMSSKEIVNTVYNIRFKSTTHRIAWKIEGYEIVRDYRSYYVILDSQFNTYWFYSAEEQIDLRHETENT